MGQPIVHFEVIGQDPYALRDFYGQLFGWEFDTSGLVAPNVSEPGNYGFVEQTTNSNAAGIPGGVGGGAAYEHRALFYVGVENVEAALASAERLGATRLWGPVQSANGRLAVGQFTDPEGNLIGVANAV